MTAEEIKNPTPAAELIVETYFPTFIFFKDFSDAAELNSMLKQQIYAWRSQDEDGIVRSNVRQTGSWHSQVDMHQREEYRELTTRVIAMAQEVYDTLEYDPAFEPICDNMWANISPKYGFNRNHTHPGVLWSGVYYIQGPPDSGRIFFSDPRAQVQVLRPQFDPDKPRPAASWTEVYYEPIEGRMLLFPAWLVHEVEPNMSDREGPDADRISVSFNLFQKRRENANTEEHD